MDASRDEGGDQAAESALLQEESTILSPATYPVPPSREPAQAGPSLRGEEPGEESDISQVKLSLDFGGGQLAERNAEQQPPAELLGRIVSGLHLDDSGTLPGTREGGSHAGEEAPSSPHRPPAAAEPRWAGGAFLGDGDSAGEGSTRGGEAAGAGAGRRLGREDSAASRDSGASGGRFSRVGSALGEGLSRASSTVGELVRTTRALGHLSVSICTDIDIDIDTCI